MRTSCASSATVSRDLPQTNCSRSATFYISASSTILSTWLKGNYIRPLSTSNAGTSTNKFFRCYHFVTSSRGNFYIYPNEVVSGARLCVHRDCHDDQKPVVEDDGGVCCTKAKSIKRTCEFGDFCSFINVPILYHVESACLTSFAGSFRRVGYGNRHCRSHHGALAGGW